jgi:translation elongation factor EF-G
MPISFKEQVDIDIGGTFLNPLEFADEHYFNGELITALADEDEFRERVSRISSNFTEGVFMHGVVLFVKRGDLARDPVTDENVTLDDQHYYVLNVEHEMGMLVLTLGANES